MFFLSIWLQPIILFLFSSSLEAYCNSQILFSSVHGLIVRNNFNLVMANKGSFLLTNKKLPDQLEARK